MKKKFLSLILFTILFSGCATFSGHHSVILTSRDQTWIIPKGAKFQAIQKPAYKTLTSFIADDDLIVLYKGTYLEMVMSANDKILKAQKAERKKGYLYASIASLLSLLAGIFGRKKIMKRKK